MYKQVIVVNKGLNMSPGKLGAMVAHGSVSYFCEWFKENVSEICTENNKRLIKNEAKIDNNIFLSWISGDFTKIVLEVENEEELKNIVEKAKSYGYENKKDFFNIVDDSTEFLDIPQWAVVAFKPMRAQNIDLVTGELNLYTESITHVNVGNVYKVCTHSKALGLQSDNKDEFLVMLVIDKENVNYRWLNLTTASLLNGVFLTKEQAENWLHSMCDCWTIEKLDVDEIHI